MNFKLQGPFPRGTPIDVHKPKEYTASAVFFALTHKERKKGPRPLVFQSPLR